MKTILMIACLLLATNISADQTKDTIDNDAQQETKSAIGSVQQEAPKGVPEWAGVNAEPSFNDNDEGLQPSYDHRDEPPFGDYRNH